LFIISPQTPDERHRYRAPACVTSIVARRTRNF
jgi:hypothetical protein